MYVTVLSGSLLDVLGNVLERPLNVMNFLGGSLPQVSIYFLSVVLSKGLLTRPLLQWGHPRRLRGMEACGRRSPPGRRHRKGALLPSIMAPSCRTFSWSSRFA